MAKYSIKMPFYSISYIATIRVTYRVLFGFVTCETNNGLTVRAEYVKKIVKFSHFNENSNSDLLGFARDSR